MLVASSLTADAILGMDFLNANKCTLEMANKVLHFPNRGVSISLQDPSSQPHIIQAQVTLEETLRILPLSEMEVMAKVSEGLHQGTWLLEECKSKNLPVSVACALVNPVTPTMPVRLLNLSSDTTTVIKGTKLATVEECNTAPIIRVMSVSTTPVKIPRVSESKRQLLEQMIDQYAADLEKDHKEQFAQVVC